jgi:hypothetical protein
MGALVCGLEKTLCIIARCKIYTFLYLEDEDYSEAAEQLRGILMKLYTLILQFLIKALRLFDMNKAKRAAHAFWNLDVVVNFEDECNKLEVGAEIAAENCERVTNRNAHAEELESLAGRVLGNKRLDRPCRNQDDEPMGGIK